MFVKYKNHNFVRMRSRLFALAALSSVVLTGCISFKTAPPMVAGVFKSIDAGENWSAKNLLLTSAGVSNIAGTTIVSLTVDPQDARTLYLGTAADGLFYSYDEGESWLRSRGLQQGHIYAIAVDPHNKCIVYATLNNTVVKSIDCARTWREVYIDTVGTKIITALAVDAENSDLLYAANAVGDMLKSSDGGVTWRVTERTKARVMRVLVDPAQPTILYGATDRRGIWKSTDRGETWEDISVGLKPFSGALEYKDLRLIPDTANGLLLTTKYGILRSGDGGATWEPLALITPPTSTDIFAVAVSPKNGKEIYYATATTFYKSVDGGANWITKRLPSAAIPSLMFIRTETPNTLFMGMSIPVKK
jgi:photosystem II stability/assembly factor-like uncharacterized protein